jgi:vitamin B12 transporter
MAFAAGMAAASVLAAEPESTGSSTADPVVVTATRTPEPLSATIRPVELIPADVIQRSGQDTMTEMLQQQANVEMAANGGPGQPSSIFLRGANSSHTLVLLDGIRVNSAAVSLAPFENLPQSQFSRIEIVPGPMSSLYGSDAMGGVIQLFTNRWPDAPRATGSIGFGSYDTTKLNGGVSLGTDTTGFTVNAGYIDSEAFSATNSNVPFGLFHPDPDGYRNTNVSANFVHQLAPDQELGLSAFYSQGRTHFDNGPTSDDVNNQAIGVYSAYSRNRLNSWWQSLVRIGLNKDDSTFDGSFHSVIDSEQTQITWQNDFKTAAGTVIAGLEYLDQSVSGTTVLSVDSRDISSVFAGYNGAFGRTTLTASVRNDDNSQFGTQPTGAIGYAFQATPGLRLRASAGSAFHAPTFFDLYDPFIGNPSVKPEEGRSWEAGLDYRRDQQRLGLTYFQNRITDLIVFDSAINLITNVGEASINGLEIGYDGVLFGCELQLRLTFQNPIDDVTEKRLPRRAKVFGNAGIARSFGPLRVGAELVGAGDRFDSVNENPATKMDGYLLFNLLATYSIARNWSMELRWNNVFNEQYELAKGYNVPSSNVFLAIQYTLR